jgi:hypothetical protein
MKSSLEKRLRELERKQAEPVDYVLRWYDEVHELPEPGTTRIQLKWLENVQP